jgi:hypothetical protein
MHTWTRRDSARTLVTSAALLILSACAPRPSLSDAQPQDAPRATEDSSPDVTAVADAQERSDASALDAAQPADALVADARNADGSDGAVAGPVFVAPDFTLPDLNPNSATHRMDVSPRAMRGRITAWYFATAT